MFFFFNTTHSWNWKLWNIIITTFPCDVCAMGRFSFAHTDGTALRPVHWNRCASKKRVSFYMWICSGEIRAELEWNGWSIGMGESVVHSFRSGDIYCIDAFEQVFAQGAANRRRKRVRCPMDVVCEYKGGGGGVRDERGDERFIWNWTLVIPQCRNWGWICFVRVFDRVNPRLWFSE